MTARAELLEDLHAFLGQVQDYFDDRSDASVEDGVQRGNMEAGFASRLRDNDVGRAGLLTRLCAALEDEEKHADTAAAIHAEAIHSERRNP